MHGKKNKYIYFVLHSLNRIFAIMKKHFPACYVELPPFCEGRRAAFYLATEEYVAEHLPEGCYFLTWIVGPTVVMGRNQVMHQEVNLDFCCTEGIDIIRRRSGGGAIFADEQNIMTSLITEDAPVEPLFQEYAETVSSALCRLGAPVQVSGRNDIVLSDEKRKICGNAFYKKANHCIVHGTMLYDTDPRRMEGALHPDINKLESKGIKSVRSRVGVLKDYLPYDVATLRQQLRQQLCDNCIALSDADIHIIERLEQRYYQPDYLYGSSNHADIVRSGRIEGVGNLEIRLLLQGSIISDVEICGDFFAIDDAQAALRETLQGRPFSTDSIHQAILRYHPERTIRGLSTSNFIAFLTQTTK